MGIRIKADYSAKDIEREIEQQLQRLFRVTLAEFQNIGLRFVQDAKDTQTYNDQTGNLRASIGYIIMYNGSEVDTKFYGDAGEGVAKGRAFARSVAAEITEGWALITVAGMEYASWVESKGYDVITGSTLGANTKMKEAWDNISKAFASKGNK